MEESQRGLLGVVSLEDQWERTFDAVPDLIMILDTQHRVVRANKALAERLKCRPEELTGLTCHELIHGRCGPPMFCPHAELIREGAAQSVEIHDERMGGTFLVSVSPIRDPQGLLMGSVHVARDITRQKRAEAEARSAADQRDTFLAMLSHELRNPLGAILNAAYIVKRAPANHGAFRDALAVIERQAAQMSFLLDDLLDVSRVMQGKIEIRQEVLDVGEILTNAVRCVQSWCDQRQQTLHVQMVQPGLTVRGDAARLQQIHVNLLTNASKYTPNGGRIDLSARQENDEVVVRVRDSGRGISTDKLQTIFDLFVQADETLDRQEGGMGIGLTLVRMLVEMHGGRVSAHSNGLGQGSEFTVRLPFMTQGLPGETLGTPSLTGNRSVKILIVEDNADSRTMLQALLQLEGHTVEVAEDGVLGLERLAAHDFDIALIDIGLPGMDGYELVRQFRSLGRAKDPCLVALTGYGRPSDREQVFAAGFDEHLVKPCDPQDLERILQRLR